MVYNKHTLFDYDSKKGNSNKGKHGLDFEEAQEIWSSSVVEIKLRTIGASRWAVIGFIKNIFWTAIVTKRNDKILIISVRRSRYEEKQAFENIFKKEDQNGGSR